MVGIKMKRTLLLLLCVGLLLAACGEDAPPSISEQPAGNNQLIAGSSDAIETFSQAIEQFASVDAYQAQQTVALVTSPNEPTSESYELSTSTISCAIHVAADQTFCNGSHEEIDATGTTNAFGLALIRRGDQFWEGAWNAGVGDSWTQTLKSSADLFFIAFRVPNGIISPFPYLSDVTQIELDGDEFDIESGGMTVVHYTVAPQTFLQKIFGGEVGQTIFESGRDYQFAGRLFIDPADGFITAHEAQIEYVRHDGTPIHVTLDQRFFEVNRPVVIPDTD